MPKITAKYKDLKKNIPFFIFMDQKQQDGIFDDSQLTPAMKQYVEIKQKHPDCIVLFRMGDFYETFYEDAITSSRVLEITLTSRGKGEKKAPLAGIPYHSLNGYLKKFVTLGYKVVIVEQIENPKNAKGRLVKRDIVRIITPGTIIEDELLEKGNNNFIASFFVNAQGFGIALCDISTGEFIISEGVGINNLFSVLKSYIPSECLIPESYAINKELISKIKEEQIYITYLHDKVFSYDYAYDTLKEHFQVGSLIRFGVESKEIAIKSAGALLGYLLETQKQGISNIKNLKFVDFNDYMVLDEYSIRNLELCENIYDKTKKYTLLEVLDKTKTAMGSRLIKRMILSPLKDVDKIKERLEAIDELKKNKINCDELSTLLEGCFDIERISSRVSFKSANPKDLASLRHTIGKLPQLKNLLSTFNSSLLKNISTLPLLTDLKNLLDQSITDEPALKVGEGNVIKEGYSKELDDLRQIKKNSKKFIQQLEYEERQKSNISTLKINYNKVIGYFISIGNAKKDLVPRDYVVKQTLVSGSRYSTQKLKELENQILGAEERILDLENSLFLEILNAVYKTIEDIQQIARQLALIDVLTNLALIAIENNYTKPLINRDKIIEIQSGRHPIVEQHIDNFITNDILISSNELIILTGPNMAGKSTFMRQIALIVLMAQLGSFVPCKHAKIGVVDRIFTRVGAHDILSQGQSTFMVEMSETANILNNATSDSLIIIDELGRGTSTYDGVSLAWSIAEYIYKHIKAKTIFATHYHVLNKLTEEYKNITNYNILVKEREEGIVFLRKIVRGSTDKSYGIHVAKLAGIPNEIIERSKEIQEQFFKDNDMLNKVSGKKEPKQLELFRNWEK